MIFLCLVSLVLIFHVKEITFVCCFTMDFFFFNLGKNAGFCSDEVSRAGLWSH